jgi:L-rhamnose mutarotase
MTIRLFVTVDISKATEAELKRFYKDILPEIRAEHKHLKKEGYQIQYKETDLPLRVR